MSAVQLSEHFTLEEMRCRGTGKAPCRACLGIFIYVPELYVALEQFRAIIGGPVIITSGVRCVHQESPEYLSSSGRVSQHMIGRAADLVVDGKNGLDLYEAAIQVPLFEQGGIGVYTRQASGRDRVHLDVRETGRARWGYIEGAPTDVQTALRASK